MKALSNKDLHPANGSIIPHLLLIAAQILLLAGPRLLPGRRALAAMTILTLAVVAQCNRFTNNPGLANLFALAWPHWLSALEKIVFASPGGPEADLWRVDRVAREAVAWPTLGWRKIKWAVTLLLNLRGIRWSYQVKNVPPVPGLDRMSRGRFLLWRLVELVLVVLMADLVSQMGLRFFYTDAAGVVGALDSKYLSIRDHRLGWSFLKALTFGLGPYYFINMQYLVVSIVAVATGISRPSVSINFQNKRDRIVKNETNQNGIGLATTFWKIERSHHNAKLLGNILASNAAQSVYPTPLCVNNWLIMQSLSTITGAFVDAVGVRRGTNTSSYTQLWLAFTISGVMHALSQLLMPRPANITPSEIVIGIFLFFPCQAAMITIEDFVIWLWKKYFGMQTPRWAPVLGYLWVVCALWFALPFAGDSMVHLKMGEVPPLPFTLAAPFVRMIPIP
ncbi:hypothetical protein FQN49_001918 [Arthroderma sp. PD_2]|nr:hypothetical protein FQN49_001918 [Arthroderma sp. PD_2]